MDFYLNLNCLNRQVNVLDHAVVCYSQGVTSHPYITSRPLSSITKHKLSIYASKERLLSC